MNKRILDIGCGKKKRTGAIGIDKNESIGTDISHDLNVFPYPIENSSFDIIYCDNILGELDNIFKTMEEIYRIGNEGCEIKVIAPYFRSRYAYIHPNIKSFFTVDSFSFFDKDHYIFKRYQYTKSTFKIEKIIFNEDIPTNRFSSCIRILANKWPRVYEKYLSHIFPLDLITFYLRKV